MRLRHIPGCEDFINSSKECVQQPYSHKGRWRDLFGNANPISLEIGMGKGAFLREMARLHPDRNFIGVERYESVLLKAVQRMRKDEEANGPYHNLRIICMDALELANVFDIGEVQTIYLNFSDPWPKKRHESRRLTSRIFLSLYKGVLARDGAIEFKTDNLALFDWSVDEIKTNGWDISYISYDLHAEATENIMTEYEAKFSQTNPICKLVARYEDFELRN